MILFSENYCIPICLKNTSKYVIRCAEDLKRDFEKRSSSSVSPQFICEETDNCIVIEENTTDSATPLKDERFTIKTQGNKIRISADGYLGTMWGIYTFSEKILGIDPCYLFNDLEIQKTERLETDDIDIEDGPESFGFRGIFVNDEDFLTGWKDDGGMRRIQFFWYGLTVSESVMNMVVETALRLKLNLIIPASFLDISNPPEKLLADCVAKRGIYLSQHHIEPLGLSAHTFANYCKKNNINAEFSYVKHPDIMEKAWADYAEKWGEYDNVVWQIGLRGEGDRPMWQEDIPTEAELKMYGGYISRAYKNQKEIILKATHGKAKYFTSTLWMEGSELIEKGLLQFPEDTILVFADCGLNQMYGNEFYTIPRNNAGGYGIYYHLQFFNSGPHLAPQTGLDKLFYNVSEADEKKDNEYFIINISNTREFVFEYKAYSEMLWNIKRYSRQKYMESYCEIFGEHSKEAEVLIEKYFKSLPHIASQHIIDHDLAKYFNFYTDDSNEGFKNFILKEGDILCHGTDILRHFRINPERKLCREYYEELKCAVDRYREIYNEFDALSKKLSPDLKKHVECKWKLFSNTLVYIYEWYVNVYEAKVYFDNYNDEACKKSLRQAFKCLEEYLKYRKCAEYGEFKNWYRGDLKMNIKQVLYHTGTVLGITSDLE